MTTISGMMVVGGGGRGGIGLGGWVAPASRAPVMVTARERTQPCCLKAPLAASTRSRVGFSMMSQ
jgi:hypothetical protein